MRRTSHPVVRRPDSSTRISSPHRCTDAPNTNHTICLRFLKTHSAVISTRNKVRTGQVFQSGIGGSVSSGTLDGLGRSLSSVSGGQRRVELAAGGLGRTDQLGLVHFDAFELVDRGIDAEAGRGDRALEDGRGQEPDLVLAFGGLRQRAFEHIPRARARA